MRLDKCEMRPGFVLKVVDNYGTIKASVTGVFAIDADPDTLPPIIPIGTLSRGMFSHPKVNDPVWVIVNRENPQELLYFRQADLTNQLSDTLEKSPDDAEVLMRTESGAGYAQVLYDTEEGLTVQNDESLVNIDKEGDITVTRNEPHRTIEINSDGISLGSKGSSSEPAVLGDKTEDALNKIWDFLNSTIQVLQSCPYTVTQATSLLAPKLVGIKSAIMKIKSGNVTLD